MGYFGSTTAMGRAFEIVLRQVDLGLQPVMVLNNNVGVLKLWSPATGASQSTTSRICVWVNSGVWLEIQLVHSFRVHSARNQTSPAIAWEIEMRRRAGPFAAQMRACLTDLMNL